MHTFKYKRNNVQTDNTTKRTCKQSKIGDDRAVLSLNVQTILKIFLCRAEIESNING